MFVPDNPNYEGRARLLFDEHNHPVDKEAHARMTPAQASRCQWRRCYKLVSLLHTNATGEFFLFAGLAVVPGNVNEGPVFWKMVDDFVAAVGKGVMWIAQIERTTRFEGCPVPLDVVLCTIKCFWDIAEFARPRLRARLHQRRWAFHLGFGQAQAPP